MAGMYHQGGTEGLGSSALDSRPRRVAFLAASVRWVEEQERVTLEVLDGNPYEVLRARQAGLRVADQTFCL